MLAIIEMLLSESYGISIAKIHIKTEVHCAVPKEVTMKRAFIILTLLFLLSSFTAFSRDMNPPERGFVNLKLGIFIPDGNSNFWNDTEETFTLNVEDMDDLLIGVDFGIAINPRMEFSIGIDYFDVTTGSEYRDYIGTDGFPIAHDTSLEIIPVQASLKILPGGRYTAGRYTTLSKIIPYIGGGIGFYLWEYRESGEFIDFSDMSVYPEIFVSDGVAVGAHVMGGIEIPFDPYWSVMMEAKYSKVDDNLNKDFSDFGTIDLSGWSFILGTSFRF